MAIAYAIAHPSIELLALTTVFGNTNIEQTTLNAQFVLDVLGATDVQVVKGAAVPIVQKSLHSAESVHGPDGLGNCYPQDPAQLTLNASAAHAQVSEQGAAQYIVETARAHPGEVTLIAVGPLTNVAQALALEPELPTLLQELIVMGGTVSEPGNVSPVTEANFLGDPHAADAVMAVHWPLTVVGLDVTHQILIGDSKLAQLRDEAGATGDLIWQSSRFYVDFYASKRVTESQQEPACAMHDAAAVIYMLMPDAFEVIHGAARVVEDGVAVGQFVVDRLGHDYMVPHWHDRPKSTGACINSDANRVLTEFMQTLVNHHVT